MADVNAGYMGIANIEGVGKVRFSDASITARQEINAPDLIMGDWDHDAYVYGPIEVGGSISGPVTDTFVGTGSTGLWAWAVARAPCGLLTPGTIDVVYYCNKSRSFGGMLANSLNFSCAAGDVAQFSIDVIGKSAGEWETTSGEFQTAEKLLTWDRVKLTTTGGDSVWEQPVAYSSFDITISNNCETVYSLGQSNLFPFEIVPGLRTITGSISVFNTPAIDGADMWIDYAAGGTGTVKFEMEGTLGTLEVTTNVRWHRVEPASSVGPVISTIGFTGVTHQTGDAWVK